MLLVHVFITVFMTGLCWFVQIVHYPLFKQVRTGDFPRYESKNFVTGYITIPLMVVEGLSGLWLLYEQPNLFYIINVVLMVVTGLSTFLFQVPYHLQLQQEGHPELINNLIKTNWIRTISWTMRTLMLGWVLYQLLPSS